MEFPIELNLVYIHIGPNLPNYFYDSLYQTLLINKYGVRIYIVVDDKLVNEVKSTIRQFNLGSYFKDNFYFHNIIEVISLSLLENTISHDHSFLKYQAQLANKFAGVGQFREGFWVSTTSRFFYLHTLMRVMQLNNCFHIENDIMMYEPFRDIYQEVNNNVLENNTAIWMVQDAPNRVVPSILFIPNETLGSQLTDFIAKTIEQTEVFINDMDILARFPAKLPLRLEPDKNVFSMIFDGAAIGQYLGGIDNRNTQGIQTTSTVGFINETSVFKPDTCHFSQRLIETDQHLVPINTLIGYTRDTKQLFIVANTHIHSKALHNFSSVLGTRFDNIISGDRILSLCDYVITTREIYQFHKNADSFAKDMIIVKDWNNVNIYALNEYFRQHCKNKKTNTVKLFVYTHILEQFVNSVLEKLDKKIEYVLYLHNSDHSFDTSYKKLLSKKIIKHVFAQNIDYPMREVDTNKLSLLPIGVANSMWKHGDLISLFEVIQQSYKTIKSKAIYVNINPNTFGYRKQVLEAIQNYNSLPLSSGKPYLEYLQELAMHRFCLCLRGNGLDTHRFWESLYLGVIPVVVNNKETRCTHFLDYVRTLDLPMIEINEDDLQKFCQVYTEEYFNEQLYQKTLGKRAIYNLPSLRLEHYAFIE
jgi:hypothetical protein